MFAMERDTKTYWVARPGETPAGPFTFEQIMAMWNVGRFTADMMICRDGAEFWSPLVKAVGAATREEVKPPCHVGVYRLLALFFGTFGAHNFFAGEVASGLFKWILVGLAAALFSVRLEFLAWLILIIVGVWAVAELINGPSTIRVDDRSDEQKAVATAARQPIMKAVLAILVVILVTIWIITAQG